MKVTISYVHTVTIFHIHRISYMQLLVPCTSLCTQLLNMSWSSQYILILMYMNIYVQNTNHVLRKAADYTYVYIIYKYITYDIWHTYTKKTTFCVFFLKALTVCSCAHVCPAVHSSPALVSCASLVPCSAMAAIPRSPGASLKGAKRFPGRNPQEDVGWFGWWYNLWWYEKPLPWMEHLPGIHDLYKSRNSSSEAQSGKIHGTKVY